MKFFILLSILFISPSSVKTIIDTTEKTNKSKRIRINNKTRFQLAVSMKYLDDDGDWVISHKVVNPGDYEYCCFTDNRIVYYYAVDTHGYAWSISGWDSYGMNAYNSYVGFRKKKFKKGKSFVLSLSE